MRTAKKSRGNTWLHRRASLGALLVIFAGLGLLVGLRADDGPRKNADAKAKTESTSKPQPVAAKPLSQQVNKGLAYLVAQQNKNGGWGQGGGWRTGEQGGRVEGANVADPPDVADTCIATLALLRAGNTASTGEYADNVARAMEFICGHVDQADNDSLYVTPIRNTQVQSKIGPYVDTFLVGLVLAEIKGQKPSGELARRIDRSLTKTIAKIEKNQKKDGTFAGNTGWASVFSQGLASKSLNRASQNGFQVSANALKAAEGNATATIDVASRGFASGAGSPMEIAAAPVAAGGSTRLGVIRSSTARPLSRAGTLGSPVAAPTDAGVAIYNFSNQAAALQEAEVTNRKSLEVAKKILADTKAPKSEKDKAQTEVDRIGKVDQARRIALEATVKNLKDARFTQGFGSNGGEEFLSYLNISEALVVQGGKDWTDWDRKVTDNLNKVQNQDGSWSGDHCITGRTFCTSTALLVLMADRAPAPTATKNETDKK